MIIISHVSRRYIFAKSCFIRRIGSWNEYEYELLEGRNFSLNSNLWFACGLAIELTNWGCSCTDGSGVDVIRRAHLNLIISNSCGLIQSGQACLLDISTWWLMFHFYRKFRNDDVIVLVRWNTFPKESFIFTLILFVFWNNINMLCMTLEFRSGNSDSSAFLSWNCSAQASPWRFFRQFFVFHLSLVRAVQFEH